MALKKIKEIIIKSKKIRTKNKKYQKQLYIKLKLSLKI